MMRTNSFTWIIHQLFVIVFAMIFLTVAVPVGAQDPTTPTNGWITWASNRNDSRHEVYVMKANGANVRRLTFNGGNTASWSPDGRWISYYATANSTAHVIRWDGSGDKQIFTGQPLFWMHDNSGVVCRVGDNYYLVSPDTGASSLLFSKSNFAQVAAKDLNPGAITHDGRWLVAHSDLYRQGYTGNNGYFMAYHAAIILDFLNPDKVYFFGAGCEPTTPPNGDWVYHVRGDGSTQPDIYKMSLTDISSRSSYQSEMTHADADWGHEYFPRISTDNLWLVYGASTGDHNHDTADYEIFVHRLGTGNDSRVRVTEDNHNDQYPDMFTCDPMTIKIMPLGDSITVGSPNVLPLKYGPGTHGGYRTYLADKPLSACYVRDFVGSQSDGPEGYDTDHEGHGGYNISGGTGGGLSANVDGWLAAYQPDLVLLMIGTNDAHVKTVQQALTELDALIEQILTGLPVNGHLLVASIPRQMANWASYNSWVIAYNAGIVNLVNTKLAQNKKVAYVEMYDTLLESDMYTDGLHPNASGYRKMADAWNAVMETVIHAGPPINSAPSVNAGADQLVLIPWNNAILDATVIDDGVPNPTVTVAWSKVSGPGTVVFANEHAVDTTATFSQIGVYVLRLAADDGELQASDEVTINVLQAGDFDADHDVDLTDFGFLQTCYSGSGIAYPQGCRQADINGDGDVDQDDFNKFRPCLGGTNRPPGC